MTTDEEHTDEFLRFVSAANQEVVHGRLDSWGMMHTADPANPGYLALEVQGIKNNRCFAFKPECTCNLAEKFLQATAILTDALAHSEGGKVTRLRRNGKASH